MAGNALAWDNIEVRRGFGTGCPTGCEDNCDVDCSGGVDAFDIEPLLDLLFGQPDPCCEGAGDADGNGVVDAFDIEPFLNCLFP